ncbi:MAG: preprotein translocase subunit SecE, partial [Oscillospiraceae bacterium]|nr:preprotein translocase subunit SecE [Oscillospiraceae bacterium]
MANEEKNIAAHAKASKTAVKRPEGKTPFLKRVTKWFREMKSELKKVMWPTPKQTANNTAVALVVMAAAAVVLWGFDSLASATV